MYPTTKLTNEEINRISRNVGIDWDSLAGLMDIPYAEREKIRLNKRKYPSFSSKAKRVFQLFNKSECFGRHNLVEYFEELRRHDLKNEMRPIVDEVFHDLDFFCPLTRVFSSIEFILFHHCNNNLNLGTFLRHDTKGDIRFDEVGGGGERVMELYIYGGSEQVSYKEFRANSPFFV